MGAIGQGENQIAVIDLQLELGEHLVGICEAGQFGAPSSGLGLFFVLGQVVDVS